METVTELLHKYRGGSPTAYYTPMSELAFRLIDDIRSTGREVPFVCHRYQGNTPAERRANILSLRSILVSLSVGTTARGFNQIYFLADINPDDPRDFDCKMEVFYKPVVAYCDRLFAVKGYEGVRGCETEIGHSRAIGQDRHLLKWGPIYEDWDWLNRFSSDAALESAAFAGWARPEPGSSIDIPFDQLIRWQDIVDPLD